MSKSGANSALLVGDSASPVFTGVERALARLGLAIESLPARESELAGALFAPDRLVILVDPPPASGRSLIDTVRRLPAGRRAPILVLSGAPDAPATLEWLQEGADLQVPCPPATPVLSQALAAAERLRSRAREVADLEERLRQAETADPLTGLPNHRLFHDRLHEEYLRCERYGKPLSVLFADLDHFRDINSTYGHKVGDGFLRGVAGLLAGAVRKVDLVARYEGEQFGLLMPETDAGRAVHAADRLRALAAGYIYKESQGSGAYRPLIKTTLSFGVATVPHPDVKSRHDLVERAQEALREAQRAGRNRVSQHPAR
jgi:diguanylate cyclase (GGDEF)-like protein